MAPRFESPVPVFIFLLSMAYGYGLGVRKASSCRRDAWASGELHPLVEQDPLQRIEKKESILALAGISHQADAPRRGLNLRESPGDLDIEFVQQAGARLCAIYADGDIDGGNSRQAVLWILNEKAYAHRFQARNQRRLSLPVAFPAR